MKSILIGFSVLLLGCAATTPSLNLAEIKGKAEAGDPVAMFTLAINYDNGRAKPAEKAEAARWYRKSAEAGFSEAQNSLGSMYQAGDGVPKDYSESHRWYEAAQKQGHPEATHNLAYLYDLGLGVSEDNAKAIQLYQAAAEKGFLTSMLNLGLSYAAGDGVAVDRAEAFKWLDLGRFYTQSSKDMTVKWRVRGALDELKKTMSATELVEGERRAREWVKARQTK